MENRPGFMRRILTFIVLAYVIAHTFYFIYSITQVSYTRRELSKKELSDGPLVLKEGVSVKGKVSGSVKKSKGKDSKKSQKLKEKTSTSEVKLLQPELDNDFVKKLIDRASAMYKTNRLLYFTLVNGAFEMLTLNWLCNVADFQGTHDRLLIVSTSRKLCDRVQEEYGKAMACLHMVLSGFEEDLDWGEQKYINYLTIRAKLMKILTEHSIRYTLIETDSIWFRDPVGLFLNATLIDDADVVVPVKGLTHQGDRLAFSPMLVEATNASIVLFEEMTKRLQKNESLYDQDVLNELCSTQYHGIVCRDFEYNEIADGKWFHLDDSEKVNMKPYIVNNNFYVGVKNKEARQALQGLWFLTKHGHCAKEKVQRAQKKFLYGIGIT